MRGATTRDFDGTNSNVRGNFNLLTLVFTVCNNNRDQSERAQIFAHSIILPVSNLHTSGRTLCHCIQYPEVQLKLNIGKFPYLGFWASSLPKIGQFLILERPTCFRQDSSVLLEALFYMKYN